MSVFARLRRELVYCSKDRSDWETAKALLSAAGVRSEIQREDDVTYVCFTLPRGGEAA